MHEKLDLSILTTENLWLVPEQEIPFQANYDIWRTLIKENLDGMSWREAMLYLVRFGQMAPSSHNMQQWRVQMYEADQSMTILPDSNYVAIPSDEYGRQAHISTGCFLANVLLAAKAYGVSPEISFTMSDTGLGQVRVENLDFSEARLNNQEALEVMLARLVYRGPFVRSHSLSEEDRHALLSLSESSGVTLHLIEDDLTKNVLGQAQYFADNVVLRMKRFREELGDYLVPNDTLGHRVMPGNTFGLQDAEAQQIQDALQEKGKFPGFFAAGFPTSDKMGIITSSAVAVLTIPQDSVENWLKAGVEMEKLWLLAQSMGYGVGVMAGMVEVPLSRMGLQKRLRTDELPVAILRIGLPDKEQWREESWYRSPRVNDMSEFVEWG